MNRLTIIGNLTRDPELRGVQTKDGIINACTLTVAVNRRRGDNNQADFFRVTAWRQMGENCAKYLRKGSKVAVVGSVSASAYTANDNSIRASLEVQADEVEFLTSRAADQPEDAAPAAPAPAPAPRQTDAQTGMEKVYEQDDLPF